MFMVKAAIFTSCVCGVNERREKWNGIRVTANKTNTKSDRKQVRVVYCKRYCAFYFFIDMTMISNSTKLWVIIEISCVEFGQVSFT